MFRGILHVHSNFSDGEGSLEHVVATFKRAGVHFIAVSDHAEVFDDVRMQQYVALCESLCTDTFVVIPGLEFALAGGDIHILGYGLTRRIRASDMEKLVDGIHEAGGIAVLAHPPAGSTNMIGPIKHKLDGIEVWNGRYDGVHTPRADSFQLLRRVRALNCKASAFGGLDLHRLNQAQRPILIELSPENLDRDDLMRALASGQFVVRGGNLTIPATGNLTFIQELSIAVKQPLCRPWMG